MDIVVDSTRDQIDVIKVTGRIDSATSPELHDRLQERAQKKRHIILEMSGVDYMSSAGVRAIVAALRTAGRQGRKVILAHPSSRVSEVLQLAGLTSIFEVYDSTGGAIGVLESQ